MVMHFNVLSFIAASSQLHARTRQKGKQIFVKNGLDRGGRQIKHVMQRIINKSQPGLSMI